MVDNFVVPQGFWFMLVTMSDKRKIVSTLDQFVIKKQKTAKTCDIKQPNVEEISESGTVEENAEAITQPSTSTSKPSSVFQIEDIANYVEHRITAADNPAELLNGIWQPPTNYKFPSSGKRNLKFQYVWFHRWNWLSYSRKQDGAYCKLCVFFAGDAAGVGGQALKGLVKNPFTNWKDAVEAFNRHQTTEYHKFSVIKSQNIQLIEQQKQIPVALQIDQSVLVRIEENRKRISPIIDTILLCGRQGISLRGHRDAGPITSSEDPVENDGNFRSILRSKLRSGDEALKSHLETMSKTGMYLSPVIQNEIIGICGAIIQNKIVKKIKSAKFFSVLADETTDIAGIEQFSLCLRFFDCESFKVQETFLKFVPVTDLTGRNLANVLLRELEELKIDCNYMVGQGYDGASAMSGVFNGVQAHVREKCKCALYVHCASHSLNLAISDACSVPQVRNCMGTIAKICNFFKSPKRQNILKEKIEKSNNETKKQKLKQLCATRWIERHDSVLTFLELQEATLDALTDIQSWRDKDVSAEAYALIKSIQSTEFQVALKITAKVFAISLPLSKFLQSTNIDLMAAMSFARSIKNDLSSLRENAEIEFHSIFTEIESVCADLDIEVTVPRTSARQTHRSNVPFQTPEEFYRRSIFVPFLDSFMLHIEERLLKHEKILSSFEVLLPRISKPEFNSEDEKMLRNLYSVYEELLDTVSFEIVLGETKMWYRCLSEIENLPENPLEALVFLLQERKGNVFPNLTTLFRIYVTIPVTSASNERSFSTLRRLKTYLRSTTAEERLNGLALLNIHREIPVSINEVLDELGKKKRRLPFVL